MEIVVRVETRDIFKVEDKKMVRAKCMEGENERLTTFGHTTSVFY